MKVRDLFEQLAGADGDLDVTVRAMADDGTSFCGDLEFAGVEVECGDDETRFFALDANTCAVTPPRHGGKRAIAERVNADIVKDAEEFIRQARAIADHEPQAFMRRGCLYTSAAHLLLAMAPLETCAAFETIPDARIIADEATKETLRQRLARERGLDEMAQATQDAGGYPELDKDPAR